MTILHKHGFFQGQFGLKHPVHIAKAALALLLLSACSAEWQSFQGWQIGSGVSTVLLSGGSLSLNWERKGNVLVVRGQTDLDLNNIIVDRVRNNTVVEQKTVPRNADGSFEARFNEQSLADEICIEQQHCVAL